MYGPVESFHGFFRSLVFSLRKSLEKYDFHMLLMLLQQWAVVLFLAMRNEHLDFPRGGMLDTKIREI